MTEKNNKRKFNLVTKVNFDEYQSILNSFESSEYKTLGHYYRDVLLSKSRGTNTPPIVIPQINRETSLHLASALKDLNTLIDQFDSLRVNEQVTESKEFITSSMEFVKKVAHASMTWSALFKGSVKNKRVIMNLAALILTSDDLSSLHSFVSKREGQQR